MRKLTIAAMMVASMAGSTLAMAGNPNDDAHNAKTQYTQHKDSAKSSAQSHKTTASNKATGKSSHSSSKTSGNNSRYQKKNYADILKNERH